MTTELGRQPWVIYGILRTADAYLEQRLRRQRALHADRLRGIYAVLSALFLVLLGKKIAAGPEPRPRGAPRRRPRPAGALAAWRPEPMDTLWFWLTAVMIAAYVLLDGFDIGAGILHRFVARNRGRARAGARARSVPSGTATRSGCSRAAARSCSRSPRSTPRRSAGFYLPLMLVLWLLIGRACAIELRHQVHDPIVGRLLGLDLPVSSVLLAICFGAALGQRGARRAARRRRATSSSPCGPTSTCPGRSACSTGTRCWWAWWRSWPSRSTARAGSPRSSRATSTRVPDASRGPSPSSSPWSR